MYYSVAPDGILKPHQVWPFGLAKETGQKGRCIMPTVMRVSGKRGGGFLEVSINGLGLGFIV